VRGRVNTPEPFDLPNTVAALAILGYTTPGGGANIYRKDVIANIGDPQTFAEAGQPLFWEDRSAAGKGNAIHLAVETDSIGTWAWEPIFYFGGMP
jgi:hypothetical protein